MKLIPWNLVNLSHLYLFGWGTKVYVPKPAVYIASLFIDKRVQMSISPRAPVYVPEPIWAPSGGILHHLCTKTCYDLVWIINWRAQSNFFRPKTKMCICKHCLSRILAFLGDHSYITSSHFWDFWTPLPPYVSMFLVLRISKNWHFLTPLPPYKWLRNIWMVPYQMPQ